MAPRLSPYVIVTYFALLLPLLAVAQQSQQPASPPQPPWDWPGPWYMWHGGWGFWWIFPLFMLIMIIGCVVAFFLGHRAGGGHRHWGPWHMMDRLPGRSWGDPTYSALEILNERFAKGEIQKQEYEERKAAILSRGQP